MCTTVCFQSCISNSQFNIHFGMCSFKESFLSIFFLIFIVFKRIKDVYLKKIVFRLPELSKREKNITMYWNPLFSVIASNLVFRKRKTPPPKGTPSPDLLIKTAVSSEAGKHLAFAFDRCWLTRCQLTMTVLSVSYSIKRKFSNVLKNHSFIESILSRIDLDFQLHLVLIITAGAK